MIIIPLTMYMSKAKKIKGVLQTFNILNQVAMQCQRRSWLHKFLNNSFWIALQYCLINTNFQSKSSSSPSCKSFDLGHCYWEWNLLRHRSHNSSFAISDNYTETCFALLVKHCPVVIHFVHFLLWWLPSGMVSVLRCYYDWVNALELNFSIFR